jgi:hypothetical protein
MAVIIDLLRRGKEKEGNRARRRGLMVVIIDLLRRGEGRE